jgi:N-acetylneuraminate synthase
MITTSSNKYKKSSVYIIAEAGVNHNGKPDIAFKLVDAALEAGADAVKFQTFKAGNIVTKNAVKADYQKQTTAPNESQFTMLKRLELAHDTHRNLIAYCKDSGIDFLSTAFDLESLKFLTNDLGLRVLKLPSGEITNGPLLLAHAKTGCQLIVSTGMATLGEVEEALGVLSFGLLNKNDKANHPSRSAFRDAYLSENGQKVLKEHVTLLHCTTEYPAAPQEINLNAMITMHNAFSLRTGYSDHSEGFIVPIAATAMGAILIEKHFTLDKNMIGPDHKSSLEPDELKEMVNAIRTVEQVMGSGVKGPMPSELKNLNIARKSLMASQVINIGDRLTEKNITIKRPGTGLSPMKYWSTIGKIAQVNIDRDDVIK